MADQKKGLPVRTEQDADERLQSKIVDYTTPSQGLAISASGEASVEVTQPLPAGTNNIGDVDVLSLPSIPAGNNNIGDVDVVSQPARSHTTDSIKVGDGTDFLAVNNDGSLNVVATATDLDIRDLDAAQDNVEAWLKDEAGNAFTTSNPLPVEISDLAGDPIHDYSVASAVVSDASANHDYTVTALKTLFVKGVICSASSRAKFEIREENTAGGGTFTTKAYVFVTSANPNMFVEFPVPLEVEAGKILRVVKTNTDNSAQDLYTTIIGTEK